MLKHVKVLLLEVKGGSAGNRNPLSTGFGPFIVGPRRESYSNSWKDRSEAKLRAIARYDGPYYEQ